MVVAIKEDDPIVSAWHVPTKGRDNSRQNSSTTRSPISAEEMPQATALIGQERSVSLALERSRQRSSKQQKHGPAPEKVRRFLKHSMGYSGRNRHAIRKTPSRFQENLMSGARAAEMSSVLSEDSAHVANRFDAILDRSTAGKKHACGPVRLVVPNLRHGIAVKVAKILSFVVREAARRHAAAGIDEHRPIKIKTRPVEYVSSLFDKSRISLPIQRISGHPFLLKLKIMHILRRHPGRYETD